MRIDYSLYTLKANTRLNALSNCNVRQGALLKVFFDQGFIGYADCHPWEELGDLRLTEQLQTLVKGQPSALMQNSLWLAQLDAQARLERRPLIEANFFPHTHFLIPNLLHSSDNQLLTLQQKGYTHLKVKVGRQLQQEALVLLAFAKEFSFKWRLDFNESQNTQSLKPFLQAIAPIQTKIDFLEDPIPFDCQAWIDLQAQGWSLACDRQVCRAIGLPEAAQILIVKSALHGRLVSDWQKVSDQELIVTSYLDHPIGQQAAAYLAQQIDPNGCRVHGLNSHLIYQSNAFSRHFNWIGPSFKNGPGTGLGFITQLNRLYWKTLC